MQKAAQAYFQTQMVTTSQGDLLLLLYEGAIKFLKQAKIKIEEKDYAEKGILISKAMDVIAELDSSLNVQRGGDLAQNLHYLYFFCNTRLLKANMRLDTAIIDEVIKVLSGLQEAFNQIIKEGAHLEQTPENPAAAQHTAAPQKTSENSGPSLFPGGLLKPKPGVGPQKTAPAAQTANGRSAVRPVPVNGAAKAVQVSQQEKTYATPSQDLAPKKDKSQPAAAAPTAKSADSGRQKPQAATAPQEVSQAATTKQAEQPAQQAAAEMPPRPPLPLNKARMLAGYKKMASQT